MKRTSFVLVLLFAPFFSSAAEVIHFGCPAYLIGATPNLPELKQKGVTSVVIDPGSGISASQAQSYGMLAVYYVNAFCQSDKFRCDGPKMSGSSVSGNYGEVIPQPESQFFYNNFSAQTQKIQQLGGTVIEIDNMDEYVRRGHTQAIRYLIEAAGKAGINVVMKNEAAAPLVALSNVVGAVVEPGSEGNGYRAAFTRAGKSTAGILLINGSASDAYTSVSNVDYSGKGGREYTTFYNCTSNAGGAKAATPPTNYQITPPPSLVSQNPTQPLVSSLQRTLTPLARPLLQQPPPQVPQQTNQVQPLQYFSNQSPTSSSSPDVYVNPQPSIAEKLLQLLRTEETNSASPSSTITLVRASTSSLTPVRTERESQGTEYLGAPGQPSTFVSNDMQNTPAAETASGVFAALLQEVANVLRKLLEFLRLR